MINKFFDAVSNRSLKIYRQKYQEYLGQGNFYRKRGGATSYYTLHGQKLTFFTTEDTEFTEEIN